METLLWPDRLPIVCARRRGPRSLKATVRPPHRQMPKPPWSVTARVHSCPLCDPPGSESLEPFALFGGFRDGLTAGTDDPLEGLVGRHSGQCKQGRRDERRAADSLPAVDADRLPGCETLPDRIKKPERLIVGRRDAAVGYREGDEVDSPGPTMLRLARQVEVGDFPRREQRHDGVEAFALPGINIALEPVATPGTRRDRQPSWPGSDDPERSSYHRRLILESANSRGRASMSMPRSRGTCTR